MEIAISSLEEMCDLTCPIEKDCRLCKHCFTDSSVDYYECQADLSEEELDRYFINDESGCPYFDPVDNDDEYYQELMGE